jgi:pyruvate/2-oxoacid:ferredoxin oxidoreductase beta subunit
MYPGNSKFLIDAYHQAIKRKNGYLLIDCHSECEEDYRLRTNILPVSFFLKIF